MQLVRAFFFFLIVWDNNGALWRRGTTYLMLWRNRHACLRAWFIVGLCFSLVWGFFLLTKAKTATIIPKSVECRMFISGQHFTSKKSHSPSRLDV